MFVELAEQGPSSNTLKNILIVVRTVLSGAIEDGIISVDPASKLGKFIPRDEDQAFLIAIAQQPIFIRRSVVL